MKRLIAFDEQIFPYRVKHYLQDNILKCIDVEDIQLEKLGKKDRQGNVIEEPKFSIKYHWNGKLYDDKKYSEYVIHQLGVKTIRQLIAEVITHDDYRLELLFRKLHNGSNIYENEDYDFEEYD